MNMHSWRGSRKNNQPIRIMQFWGGVPRSANSKWRRTLRLIQKCAEESWKTSIVFSSSSIPQNLVLPFQEAGAEILEHRQLSGSLNLKDVAYTYRFLSDNPCDLIHCYNRPLVPLLSAALCRVPVRIWSRLAMSPSYETNESLTGMRRLQLNLRLSCLLSKRIFCISKPVFQELTGLYKSVEEKTAIVGAAVDLDRYASGAPGNIREEFSLAAGDLILLSIGHAVPVKGWDVLLSAYAKFRYHRPNSKLLLVGSINLLEEKKYSEKIFRLIDELGIGESVILTGKREDIPELLAAADIFVQPSRSEGLCGALIEALAAGLPCIASNVGGTSDLINHGINGLMFEREDVDGLLNNLLDLSSKPRLMDTFKSNAGASVEPYKIDSVTDKIVGIYWEMLSQRGYL